MCLQFLSVCCVDVFQREEGSLEMSRKLNLSHLTDDECKQILKVIQRDFDIRQKEKGRLA